MESRLEMIISVLYPGPELSPSNLGSAPESNRVEDSPRQVEGMHALRWFNREEHDEKRRIKRERRVSFSCFMPYRHFVVKYLAANGTKTPVGTEKEDKKRVTMEATGRMKSADEILRSALMKEKGARDFYQGLLVQCRVDSVRQLVEKLRDEEAKHVKMIETMMSKLRLGHDAA